LFRSSLFLRRQIPFFARLEDCRFFGSLLHERVVQNIARPESVFYLSQFERQTGNDFDQFEGGLLRFVVSFPHIFVGQLQDKIRIILGFRVDGSIRLEVVASE
jgi:hypothetical protein